MPLARSQLRMQTCPHELVFIDDNPSAEVVNGHRVLSYSQFCREAAVSRYVAIAIANSRIRQEIASRFTNDGVEHWALKAPSAVILDDVVLGEGYILNPFVTLTSNIKVGRQFQANIYSYVGHDCVIGDFVTFAPAVKCNGNVVVEDHAYIGTGAVLKQGKPGRPLVIGRGAVVGMGAVVTGDVAPGTTVVGNPARPMEKK